MSWNKKLCRINIKNVSLLLVYQITHREPHILMTTFHCYSRGHIFICTMKSDTLLLLELERRKNHYGLRGLTFLIKTDIR